MHVGMLLALFGTLLFSLKSIFIKFAYAQGLDANTVLVFRMAISVPFYIVILGYLLFKRKNNQHTPALSNTILLQVLGVGFLGYYLASLLDLMGLEYITAQLERLTLFTYPFMVAIIGYFLFNQALSKRLIISLMISYIGLWIVMGQELQITGNNVLLGTSLVMGAALSFSFYVLLSKPMIKKLGSLLFTALAMSASSLLVFTHGAIQVDFSTLEITTEAWRWLILLAVFSTVLPSFMMSEAIQRIGPTQTGIMGTLGPIFTIILAVYLLNEPVSLTMIFGMMMVICGVGVLMVKKKLLD